MSTKRSEILEELKVQDVEGFSEAQKKYYVSLGYRPYRSASGSIKWLSPSQHSRRIYNVHRRNFIQRLFAEHPKIKPHRRKHRSKLSKFFQAYWLFLLIMMVIAILVLLLLRHPQILIRG